MPQSSQEHVLCTGRGAPEYRTVDTVECPPHTGIQEPTGKPDKKLCMDYLLEEDQAQAHTPQVLKPTTGKRTRPQAKRYQSVKH